MKYKFKTYYFLVFIFAFSVNICLNYLNKNYLISHPNEQGNTKTLLFNGTIYSIDNSSYIDPIVNYIHNNVYELEKGNQYTKFRRTPGYPIFYGLHYYILGEELTHKVIGYSQSIIFALSVICLGLATSKISSSYALGALTSLLYSFCPFVIGYTFFTITESLYPSFVVFSFYAFASYYRSNNKYWALLTGIFIGISALIRPTNILLIIPVSLIILLELIKKRGIRKQIIGGLCVTSGLTLVFAPWVIRNYKESNGEIIFLEKFYQESPMGMGRSQTYLSKWWMCFGNPHPEEMVYNMVKSNDLPLEKRYKYILDFSKSLPKYVYKSNSQAEVFNSLKTMQDCYFYKKQVYGVSIKTLKPDETEVLCEFETKKNFSLLIQKFKKEQPIRYYFYSPIIIRGKEFIFQSFSSMYGSLNPTDNPFSLIQKTIKAGFYLLNLILFASFFISFFNNNYKYLRLFVYSFVFSLFLLIVFLVHIETRYFLAAYPFLYILLANNLCLGLVKVRRNFTFSI